MTIKDIPRFETHALSSKFCISKHNNSLVIRGGYNARNL